LIGLTEVRPRVVPAAAPDAAARGVRDAARCDRRSVPRANLGPWRTGEPRGAFRPV